MLLALDTASNIASVAVYDPQQGRLLAEMTWEGRRRQTQDLMGIVRQLLATVAVAPRDLSALAATTGPGSFTGVRIAISALKGIGMGLATVPAIVGVPTLSVTAAPWLPIATACNTTSEICAVMHAGRGRYHWTFFAAGAILHRPGAAEHHTGTATELAASLALQDGRSYWLAGEVDRDLAGAVTSLPHIKVIEEIHATRRAGALAHLAAALLAAGEADTLATLQPLYLREP